jgi:hypothetical protein
MKAAKKVRKEDQTQQKKSMACTFPPAEGTYDEISMETSPGNLADTDEGKSV